jgi:hypothetical protein
MNQKVLQTSTTPHYSTNFPTYTFPTNNFQYPNILNSQYSNILNSQYPNILNPNALSAPNLNEDYQARLLSLTQKDNQAKQIAATLTADMEQQARIDDDFEETLDTTSFDDYRPKKLNIGRAHPDSLVESSSLAAVEPPDITYTLHLPETVSIIYILIYGIILCLLYFYFR